MSFFLLGLNLPIAPTLASNPRNPIDFHVTGKDAELLYTVLFAVYPYDIGEERPEYCEEDEPGEIGVEGLVCFKLEDQAEPYECWLKGLFPRHIRLKIFQRLRDGVTMEEGPAYFRDHAEIDYDVVLAAGLLSSPFSKTIRIGDLTFEENWTYFKGGGACTSYAMPFDFLIK